jgi:hypothetical protein
VDDLALVEVDLPLEGAVREVEDPGLPTDADELNDVGKMKLSE